MNKSGNRPAVSVALVDGIVGRVNGEQEERCLMSMPEPDCLPVFGPP